MYILNMALFEFLLVVRFGPDPQPAMHIRRRHFQLCLCRMVWNWKDFCFGVSGLSRKTTVSASGFTSTPFSESNKKFLLFLVCVCRYVISWVDVVMGSHQVYQTFHHRPMLNEHDLARLLIMAQIVHRRICPFSPSIFHSTCASTSPHTNTYIM